MKTAVYIDVLFVINFIINFLLLMSTAKITKNRASPLRISVGACTGALYAVLMFFPQITMLYSVACKILVSVIIVSAAFKISSLRLFFKTFCVFYITSFIFGAVCLGVFYFTGGGKGSVISNGIFYFNLHWRILIFSSFASYIIIRLLWRAYKTNKIRSCKSLRISLFGKSVSVRALIDTGNSLKDPLSNLPVAIVPFECVKPILPDTFKCAYKSTCGCPESLLLNAGDEMSGRLRLIPFSSVGASRGLLLGFKPDSVVVERFITKNIIIALSDSPLSSSDDYDALINPEIFTA